MCVGREIMGLEEEDEFEYVKWRPRNGLLYE